MLQHVVVIVQENRTTDNLFNGLPGADTVSVGTSLKGTPIPLHEVPLVTPYDLGHSHRSFVGDYDNGTLDGFQTEPVGPKAAHAPPDPAFGYVDRADVEPYWQMATQYTFADRMFESNTGPSYVAHQYLIAGQSDYADENPNFPKTASKGQQRGWGCDDPPGTEVPILAPDGQDEPGTFPCKTYATLGDLMDNAGVSWAYYAPAVDNPGGGYIWSAYDAIQQIRRGPDWAADVISPQTSILTDVAAGQLRAVSYVAPSALNSDHARENNGTGPAWVSAVVNAIGRSKYWDNTAIIITWDDWGGWYDHVLPPKIDRMGPGFRVPMIVVSPYAKHAYVSHVQHEFGSILHFIEVQFGLPSLGTRDAVSDALADCFDFSGSPAPFTPIVVTGRQFDPNDRSAVPPDDDAF